MKAPRTCSDRHRTGLGSAHASQVRVRAPRQLGKAGSGRAVADWVRTVQNMLGHCQVSGQDTVRTGRFMVSTGQIRTERDGKAQMDRKKDTTAIAT